MWTETSQQNKEMLLRSYRLESKIKGQYGLKQELLVEMNLCYTQSRVISCVCGCCFRKVATLRIWEILSLLLGGHLNSSPIAKSSPWKALVRLARSSNQSFFSLHVQFSPSREIQPEEFYHYWITPETHRVLCSLGCHLQPRSRALSLLCLQKRESLGSRFCHLRICVQNIESEK